MSNHGGADTLGILTPGYGRLSETFIHRHVQSIMPGRTVLVARKVYDAGAVACTPLLNLEGRRSPRELLSRTLGDARLDPHSRQVRGFLEHHGVTAVMGEWLGHSCLWFPVVRPMGIRFFAHAHGYDVTEKALSRRQNRNLYRRLLQMDGVIVVSRLTKQHLIDTVSLDAARVHVVPCCVEIPNVLPERGATDHIRCIHVGRLVDKKGPLLTLKAFHAAYRENRNLRLDMIGRGPLLSRCQDYCEAYGLSEVVTLYGGMDHHIVKERLMKADIFLLHSMKAANGDEEGLPVALLEAMAHGLPVVSTRHAGIPEAVSEGETGFLVSEGDVDAVAGHIIELAGNQNLRESMGRAGHAAAAERFSVEWEMRRLRELMFGINGDSEPCSTGSFAIQRGAE